MRVWSNPEFVLPLPEGHRFPMAKYRLLHERVAAAAHELGIEIVEAPPASLDDLYRVHDPGYVARVLEGGLSVSEQRRIGFPWSPMLAARALRVSGATIAALRTAIERGSVSATLAGGTHHAAYAHGAGYCVFNDSVVAARHALAHGLARRVLVVDLDVHHGDGTASLVAGDPRIFAFSMHAERNYPAVKPPGDLDVPLPDGLRDPEYLALLERHLDEAIERARPDAVIYLAGADPYERDRLGFLKLTKAGLAARDRHVLATCRRLGLPVAVSMAGGYADSIDDLVEIHFRTVAIAAELAREPDLAGAEPGMGADAPAGG
jgi:acetoin utilization deacetylase AcuC-like enzyme